MWKLTKMTYGITEVGRKWVLVFEEWLTEEAGIERVSRVAKCFVKIDTKGLIFLMMAKVTDDLMMVGSRDRMEGFVAELGKMFYIRNYVIDDTIRLNGCLIRREPEGDILMSMTEYSESIE